MREGELLVKKGKRRCRIREAGELEREKKEEVFFLGENGEQPGAQDSD